MSTIKIKKTNSIHKNTLLAANLILENKIKDQTENYEMLCTTISHLTCDVARINEMSLDENIKKIGNESLNNAKQYQDAISNDLSLSKQVQDIVNDGLLKQGIFLNRRNIRLTMSTSKLAECDSVEYGFKEKYIDKISPKKIKNKLFEIAHKSGLITSDDDATSEFLCKISCADDYQNYKSYPISINLNFANDEKMEKFLISITDEFSQLYKKGYEDIAMKSTSIRFSKDMEKRKQQINRIINSYEDFPFEMYTVANDNGFEQEIEQSPDLFNYFNTYNSLQPLVNSIGKGSVGNIFPPSEITYEFDEEKRKDSLALSNKLFSELSMMTGKKFSSSNSKKYFLEDNHKEVLMANKLISKMLSNLSAESKLENADSTNFNY